MAKDPEVIIMPLQQYRDAFEAEYEHGYITALMALQNKLQAQWKPLPPNIRTVITHIQDMIVGCTGCGTKLIDKPCPTCAEATSK